MAAGALIEFLCTDGPIITAIIVLENRQDQPESSHLYTSLTLSLGHCDGGRVGIQAHVLR